jgi:hypothetical protein
MILSFNVAGRLAVGAIALVAALGPAAARAQDVPSYAVPTTTISTDETIHGRIHSVNGAFDISVDDDRGFVDNVELHQGTIINPTGLTLAPGMSVTILGVNSGAALSANEIDTPYTYDGPLPTPVYLGPGYWYPGFAYGYGPSFNLAIVIGGGYPGGYGFVHHPFYGRPWDGHAYFGAAVGFAGPDRSRFVQTHGTAAPNVRYPTAGVRAETHQPAAFAGRSFAGGDRTIPTRSGEPTRSENVGNWRGSEVRSAATVESRGEAARRGGVAPRGGAAPRGGGEHAASHGGGGHPH